MTDRPRFFFVHVMKTAGTSFVEQHFRPAFAERELYPNAVDDEMTYDFVESPYWKLAPLRDLDVERRARTVAYSGHFPYCAVELVDGPDLVTLTLLRDPVERTLSYLAHCRRYHPFHADLAPEAIYDQEEWYRRFIENHQTKVFSMRWDDEPTHGHSIIDVDADRLAAARAALDRVDVVGVSHRFETFVDHTHRRFGWPGEVGPRRRVGEHLDVPDSFRRRIAEDNALDAELFAHAERRAAELGL